MTPRDIIAEVHAQDVERARQLIRSAIARASDDWLPMNAIADALRLEMEAFGCPGPSRGVACRRDDGAPGSNSERHRT